MLDTFRKYNLQESCRVWFGFPHRLQATDSKITCHRQLPWCGTKTIRSHADSSKWFQNSTQVPEWGLESRKPAQKKLDQCPQLLELILQKQGFNPSLY